MAEEIITTTAPADIAQASAITGAINQVTAPTQTAETTDATDNNDAEIARLKAELAKAKAATDKATKEAGDAKKALRAKQSAEEIAAEEKRVADEAMQTELNELRKRFAVAETAKKVMEFIKDESVADEMAGYLYGAEDTDAAVALFKKAWMAAEKALRLEYGKIPAPGAGAADGPAMTKEDILKIKDPVLRQQKIAENINLFMKGS